MTNILNYKASKASSELYPVITASELRVGDRFRTMLTNLPGEYIVYDKLNRGPRVRILEIGENPAIIVYQEKTLHPEIKLLLVSRRDAA